MKNGASQFRSKQSSVLACAVLALCCIASPAIAEDHSGSTGSATWTLVGSPHIIIGEVTVGNGDTLTIEPGCEIKFDGDYRLNIQGTLIADGEPADHITFTSNQPTPNPGDWQFVYFYLADAGCLLDYCDISYGGSSLGNIYVRSSGSDVTISNCTIEQSDSSGVYVYGAAPTISGCTIQDNDYAGIQCHDTSSDPLVSNCTIQGNGNYAIRTYGGNVADLTGNMTITGNTYDAIWVGADGSTIGTWLDHDLPLVIGGELTVTNGDTLTINPGCTLKFDGDYRLYVQGTLIADGAPADHITFTSNQSSPSPGDWQAVHFYLADAGCLLDYCDISYGGSSLGNVYVRSSGSNVAISNCIIEKSADAGIYIFSTSSDPSIFDCTIQDNLGYAIRTCGRLVDSITGNMTITGNTYNAILVESDGSTTGTWLDHNVSYAIGGELTVPNGGTLFLSPGCTLKFNGNDRLYVAGTLIADGEPADHVTLTSNQASPSPGDWQAVHFYLADAGCLLDYCDISYGGSTYGNVYVRSSGSNVAISNCTIEQSDSSGVYVHDSAPTVSACTIRDNDYAGIQCQDTSSDPLVSNCTIQGNGNYAIRTYGGNVTDLSGTMTFTGNGYDAILVGQDGNTIGTWLDLDLPLVIGGDLTVTNEDTLTINPGCLLKFNGDYRLNIHGTLIADGEPSNHITFTSNQPSPSPGAWQNLYFYQANAGCLLDYCDISYGGSSNGSVHVRSSGSNVTISNCVVDTSATAGVYVYDGSAPTITDCLMRGSSGAGIRCNYGGANPIIDSCVLEGNLYGYQGGNASPQFTYNNQIINNTSYGFYITGNSTPTFGSTMSEWNDIYGNGTYEFYNGASDVYAYYVYWGDTDPSVIASRIFDDNDNTALGIVYFTHWLNEAHDSENTLTPPIINTITATADSVHITWSSIPGASSYKMYSSDKPYSGFQQDLTGLFNGLNWAAEITDLMKFFHVTAAAEPEESGSSNTVGFERYEADAVAAISGATPSIHGR